MGEIESLEIGAATGWAAVNALGDRQLKLCKPSVLIDVAALELDFAVYDVKEAAALQTETLAIWSVVAKFTQERAATLPLDNSPLSILQNIDGMSVVIGKRTKEGDETLQESLTPLKRCAKSHLMIYGIIVIQFDEHMSITSVVGSKPFLDDGLW